jgi:2-oxoglutarate dehydrogenase E1 component
VYPLPTNQLKKLQEKYSKANWFWVQEEPLNMGAASFLKMNLHEIEFKIISRNASASTATGYAKVHAKEQLQLIENACSI